MEQDSPKPIGKRQILRDSSPERDFSDLSDSPPRKQRNYNSRRKTPVPLGFRRSTCIAGHACGNTECFTAIEDQDVMWDRKHFKKPTKRRSRYVRPEFVNGEHRSVSQARIDTAVQTILSSIRNDARREEEPAANNSDKLILQL